MLIFLSTVFLHVDPPDDWSEAGPDILLSFMLDYESRVWDNKVNMTKCRWFKKTSKSDDKQCIVTPFRIHSNSNNNNLNISELEYSRLIWFFRFWSSSLIFGCSSFWRNKSLTESPMKMSKSWNSILFNTNVYRRCTLRRRLELYLIS